MVVFVALAPALCFHVYSESEARRTRQQLVEDEALRTVRLVTSEQQRIIEGAEQVLTAIGAAPSVQDREPERCRRMLAGLLQALPRYNAAAVLGLDGHPICSPDPFDPTVDLSARTYFRLALETGGFVIGEYAVGRASGQAAIHMAKPFMSSDGAVAGVVTVALSLDWLAQQLKNLPLPPGASASVRDRNGILLARYPDGPGFVGSAMPPSKLSTLQGNAFGVADMLGIDGVRRLVAYAPISAGRNGLRVAVGLDRNLAFAAVTQANQIGLVLIIAGVGLALAMTVVLGTRLIRHPVNRLLDVADLWRTGDLAARTGVRGDSSEFGRLADAFDRMAMAHEARERELRQSEQHFRATFEHAAVGMAQVALNGAWLRVNDKLCAITGYPREELLTRTFQAITHPDDLEVSLSQMRALLAGDRDTYTMEKRYLRRDGGSIWVNLTVSLVRDGDAIPDCFIGVVEDITARKSAEAALRESETRLQLAREAAGFGVVDYDVLTNTMVWSEVHWRLHGFEPQASGPDYEAWRRRVHPEDVERVVAEMGTALGDPAQPFDTEYRVIWPDGTVHWIAGKATVVRGKRGEPLRMVGLSMDVTASRETEAALRRLSIELEERVREEVGAREAAQARAAHAERMQALGQLAGGIAHDFNNVLQGVAGAAALIERRPGDETGVRRLARLVVEAADRGASITRRLLAFGRRGDLRAEALDTAELLNGLREIFAHTLGSAIAVQVRLGARSALLLADRGQLETVLVNLATNARDAMPGGGRLTLSVETEMVLTDAVACPLALAPGRYVRLTLADTGAGMDAATLGRAAEPFFTTKPPGVGTGLGLPMAKGFAEQSGGALSIASSLGKGTTVTLWLPEARVEGQVGRAVTQIATYPTVPLASNTTPAARVLVVDDEDLVREVIAQHLEDAGYRVLVAANGTEALALLAAGETLDALATDLSMPDMDGLAVIRAAQERHPGLPAILLTGYAGDGAALAVGGAVSGTFSLLRKPVSGVQLVDRLQVLLAVRTGTNLQ